MPLALVTGRGGPKASAPPCPTACSEWLREASGVVIRLRLSQHRQPASERVAVNAPPGHQKSGKIAAPATDPRINRSILPTLER